MKPVFQRIYSTTDGDCFAACIASILELPIEDVPNFVDGTDPDWWQTATCWLFARGYLGVWLQNPDLKPLGYHIAGCDRQQTEHGEIGHNVVTKDGIPVHCPTHGDKPRIPDRIHEWFLLVPIGWPLKLVNAEPTEVR